MHSLFALASTTAALVALVPTALAQGEILTLPGPGSSTSPYTTFGSTVSGGGFANADAHPDLVVGDPDWSRTFPEPAKGLVQVLSGEDGSVLHTFTDGPLLPELGGGVACAGDVDGDGVNDALMTAVDYGPGAIQVVSGADGSLLHRIFGIGSVAAGVGDVDGDGLSDLVVGDPEPGASRVKMISGADGATLWTLTAAGGETTGLDVDGGADVDGDGWPDVLVLSQETGVVYARVHSGPDGALVREVTVSVESSCSARTVRFLGYLDADEVEDFAVGVPDCEEVHVFSGSDGTSLYQKNWNSYDSTLLGHDMAGLGDIDEDGHDDFIVGAPAAGQFFLSPGGGFFVYSGLDGALILGREFNGNTEGEQHGSSVASAGDVDGDGLGDYAVGVPDSLLQTGGRVDVYSSGTGAVVRSFGSAVGGALGMSMCSLGDVDGDGEPELLAGNPYARSSAANSGRASILSPATSLERHFDGQGERGLGGGSFVGDVNADGYTDFATSLPWAAENGFLNGAVIVHSGLDGSQLLELRGPHYPYWIGFGPLAPAGDVNGDGHDDLAVSAPYEEDPTGARTGSVRMYSGLDGSVLFERFGATLNGTFGRSLDGGEDVDGDGVPDLVVGSALRGMGQVQLVSGADGSTLLSIEGSVGFDYGQVVRWLGDLSGDGVPDFLTRRRQPNAWQAHSGADGSILFRIDSLTSRFSLLGDVSGDGVPDMALGYWYDDANGNSSGRVDIHSGVDRHVIASYVGASATARFGSSLSAAGDVDLDGIADWAVGAPSEDSLGVVRIFSGACLQAASYCTVNPHSGGIPARLRAEGPTSVSYNDFKVVAVDGPPGKFCVFFYGPTRIDTPFGDGRRCVGGNVRRIQPALLFDAAGRLERQLDFTVPPASSGSHQVFPGSTWNFQGWFRDPMGPGGTGFNLTDGLEVTFCE